MDERQLRIKGRVLDPCVRIGKKGITPGIIKEIQMHLKKKRLVKIKFLPSFLDENDKKESAYYIASETKSRLISQIGFTVVLYR